MVAATGGAASEAGGGWSRAGSVARGREGGTGARRRAAAGRALKGFEQMTWSASTNWFAWLPVKMMGPLRGTFSSPTISMFEKTVERITRKKMRTLKYITFARSESTMYTRNATAVSPNASGGAPVSEQKSLIGLNVSMLSEMNSRHRPTCTFVDVSSPMTFDPLCFSIGPTVTKKPSGPPQAQGDLACAPS